MQRRPPRNKALQNKTTSGLRTKTHFPGLVHLWRRVAASLLYTVNSRLVDTLLLQTPR